MSSDPPAASAPRRPTGDPDVYLIPTAQLPPGFAEAVDHPAETPTEPRPAATVALVRDGDAGPEVLLLRRHRRSGFAADAWVFPGGVVDAEDRDPALAELLTGLTPAAWAHRMEVADPAEALGYVVAAVREVFEETGILLARDAGHAACAGRAYAAARRALLAGETGIGRIAAVEGVYLAGGDLLYLAHWVTPEAEPRRYDTRFFLARAPGDAECTPHRGELTEARWMTPPAAARAFHAGELKMLPPTVHTLRRLAAFTSVAEAWSALEGAPVPRILPRMRRHPEGIAIEIGQAEEGDAA